MDGEAKGLWTVPESPGEVTGDVCGSSRRTKMKSKVRLYLVEEEMERTRRHEWRPLVVVF